MTQVNTEGRDMVNIILKTNVAVRKRMDGPLQVKTETKDKTRKEKVWNKKE